VIIFSGGKNLLATVVAIILKPSLSNLLGANLATRVSSDANLFWRVNSFFPSVALLIANIVCNERWALFPFILHPEYRYAKRQMIEFAVDNS
jgi:hypothetical protein